MARKLISVIMILACLFMLFAGALGIRDILQEKSDGEKEKAIGLYRQLLKNPKWKQSGASSQAHQALERFGIATGGAMTNEVR